VAVPIGVAQFRDVYRNADCNGPLERAPYAERVRTLLREFRAVFAVGTLIAERPLGVAPLTTQFILGQTLRGSQAGRKGGRDRAQRQGGFTGRIAFALLHLDSLTLFVEQVQVACVSGQGEVVAGVRRAAAADFRDQSDVGGDADMRVRCLA
jgi:hypothetical protein